MHKLEKDFVHREALVGDAADQLRGFIRAIEKVEAKIDNLNAEKADIYGAAKACGFCKKTIRTLLTRRRKNALEATEEDNLLSIYEATLDLPERQ